AVIIQVSTWLELYDKLMPNGRLMVNCGAAHDGASSAIYSEVSSINGSWLNWKKMPKEEGENYLALTGPLPDLNMWSAVVPDRLKFTVKQWRPCLPP
ncbi:hypothetical protein U1Q18_019915, partial [Sarracenia purpurea var. burkii]